MRTAPVALVTTLLALLLIGCGGLVKSSTPSSTSNTPAASGGTTTPPSPPPSVPTTGSNSGMYQVQLVSYEHPQTSVGQVTVDPVSNNGDMNVTLNQVVANATVYVHFCRFSTHWMDCFEVGSATTDGSGNASASMKFPKQGTWAGVFYVSPDNWTSFSGATIWYASEPSPYGGNFNVGQNYRVGLYPESSVSGGIGMAVPASTLGSGFVSINGNMVHVEVHGAAPNTTYQLTFCANGGFNSSCNEFGSGSTFTTNASGNGSTDLQATSAPSEVFFVDPNGTRGGFVTAFVVQ